MVATLWKADPAFSHPLPEHLFQNAVIVAETPVALPEPTGAPASEQPGVSEQPVTDTESSAPLDQQEEPSRLSQPVPGNQPTTVKQEQQPAAGERSQPSKPSNTDTFGAFDRALYGS
ncbi:hypothetical protein J5X98_23100 [Leptothermofonsia sichuanensis E412]|uniref:hypothetical protein n=1 Tax=Leptothermofonsia sichuanensis TaxID=2917832 RepID=UPI001CA7030C|nr:hypothetical protein [Leptothermofonsia sichuanensis]QZZ20131.1 hypothetical protein J5X98_23100 [Leptothermofonsia sichuanensis E412]